MRWEYGLDWTDYDKQFFEQKVNEGYNPQYVWDMIKNMWPGQGRAIPGAPPKMIEEAGRPSPRGVTRQAGAGSSGLPQSAGVDVERIKDIAREAGFRRD